LYNKYISVEVEFSFMGRIFASDLRAKRMELSKKSKDLQAGAVYLQKARLKLSAIEGGLPTGIEENIILQQAEELKEKATALEQSIRAEEVSVFTYKKVKGGKTYKYWKAEWRAPAPDSKIKQVHLGRAEGKKALSQDEALAKARRAKAEDLKINTAGRED
jgi:hypothetical protein